MKVYMLLYYTIVYTHFGYAQKLHSSLATISKSIAKVRRLLHKVHALYRDNFLTVGIQCVLHKADVT